MTAFFDVLLGGVFHASVLFLVAAGLQLVFGVQKIVNLACGSFYALGAYFAMQVYRAGVEAAYKAKNAWPSTEDVINSIEGIRVESLGGPGQMRKDHVPEQTFYQGLTTHNNKYDFPTLGTVDTMFSTQLQKPKASDDFWKWIETAEIKL